MTARPTYSYSAPTDEKSRAELAAMFGRPADLAELLVAECIATAARLSAEFRIPVCVVVGPGPGMAAPLTVYGEPQP